MAAHLKVLLLAALAVFAPIKAAILVVLVLVCLDLVLGVVAAHRRGEPITSRGLRRTVGKLLVFELALMTAFLVETYLTGGLLPLVKIVAAFIGMAELKSVLENLNEISGGSLLKALLEKIGKTTPEP